VLASKRAIVSRLASIEELAGMDVLCSDKTGTLTENRLTLGEPYSVAGVSPELVILAGALASRAENKDPIDLAVLAGLRGKLDTYHVTHFQPFDPVRKRTEAAVTDPGGNKFHVSKGAVQVILSIAANRSGVEASVGKAIAEFAARGFRSLGVAQTDAQGRWQFLGILPLYDPPREDSMDTIADAKKMGVRVKMVTGDQIAIAKETARQLGLGPNILDASGFGDTAHHDQAQMADAIEDADGFAQVFPEHKYHIVALKKADAGIAVSGATDAARAAADIVLTTPGLSVIITAIRESRKIFQRMTSYAIYRIAETIRVLFFMTLSILVFNFYPVTAVMIVLLALLNDGAILSIAYDRVRYSNQPEKWDMRSVLGIATVLGIAGVISSFVLFFLADRVWHLSRETLQSLMYLKLSVAGHMTIFVTRTRGPFWSTRPARILWGAVLGTQAVATLIAVYGFLMSPIGWWWASVVWAYALAWFLVNDRVKLLAYRIFGSKESGLLGKLRIA
jgi:H+-transporting ATPase